MYILSVEDDSAIREAIQDVLSFAGYEVKTAENGKEALDLLHDERFPPDLILLDLMMPVMDGWRLIEELNKENDLSKIPVVIVSAVASTESVHSQPNVKKVIKKPVVIEQLLNVVKDICGPAPSTQSSEV
jgi:two-component system response regulator CpxR